MNDNMHDYEVMKEMLGDTAVSGPAAVISLQEDDFTGATLAALLAQMACAFNEPKLEAVLIRPRSHRKRFPIPPRKI